MEAAMLIGGEWRQAASSEEIEVVNPATEEVVGSVPAPTSPTWTLAVETARRAFPEWAATDVEERAHVLRQGGRADRGARQRPRRAADLRAGQAGRRGARRGHPPRARRALLRRGGDQGERRVPGAAVHVRARLRPGHPPPDGRVRGDHALQLPADPARDEGRARAGDRQHGRRQAGGDDAAGDARGRAAVRRGRRARRRAQRRHRAAARRSATRSSATPTCAASPSPASTEVGRHVMAIAGPALKRVSLELGGSDPVIVCADADVDAAVKAVIIGRYWNAGQACLGLQARLRRTTSVYDDFVGQLVDRVGRYEPGDGTVKAEKPRLRMGPIHTRAGRDELLDQLEDGVAHGGELLIGGGTGGQRQGLLPRARRRRRAGRRLAARHRGGVRPGAAGVPLQRLRRRDPPRERHVVRPGVVDLDARRAQDPPRGDRRSRPA